MASFATPEEPGTVHKTLEESASELYALLEEHFDEMGLSDEERDERYTRAAARVNEETGAVSKPSA